MIRSLIQFSKHGQRGVAALDVNTLPTAQLVDGVVYTIHEIGIVS